MGRLTYKKQQCFNNGALQAEISLCRVYKRAGVDDHRRSPNNISSKASSSTAAAASDKKHSQIPLPSTSYVLAAGEPSPSSNIPLASLSSDPMEADSSQYHLHPTIHSSAAMVAPTAASLDELNRIVSYLNQPVQLLPLHQLPPVSSNKLWEWNPFADSDRDYSANFK